MTTTNDSGNLQENSGSKSLARVELWDAINEYTQACGGNTARPVSDRRMNAVVAVEKAAGRFGVVTADLVAALTWLLDDMADAGEDCNPETGDVYDSVQLAREVLAKAIG